MEILREKKKKKNQSSCELNQDRAYFFMWVAIWECQWWLAQWGTGSWVRPLGTTIIQAAQVIPGLPPHLSSLWWAHKGTGGIQGPGLIPLCYFLQHLKVPVVFTISSFLTCSLFNCLQTLLHSMEEGLLKNVTPWYEQDSTLQGCWQKDGRF